MRRARAERRARLRALALAVCCLAAACDRGADAPVPDRERAAAAVPGRPSIVLLLSIDTLRADRLGAYGGPRPTSPALDAIAAEGVLFEDASATSPWTLPSHASMLTGLYPAAHGAGAQWQKLSQDVVDLATLLDRAGYHTAAVVNTTYLKPKAFGLTRGFAHFLWVEEHFSRRAPSRWVTEQATAWIRDESLRPLFLMVHYYDVHADYKALPRYQRKFLTPYDGIADGTAMQLTYADLDEAFVEACRTDFDVERCTFGKDVAVRPDLEILEGTEADVRRLLELYDAGIRQTDDQIGKLVEALRSAGVLDDTLLIVTSDHGEEFMEHGGFSHGRHQHQEALRVPLLMRGPGIPAGLRVDAPVSLVDIAPTVLARLGLRIDRPMDGMDLSPLFEPGASAAPYAERYVYAEAPGWMNLFNRPEVSGAVFPRAVRKGRYKLHYESYSGTYQLYDLVLDPGEQTDVSDAHPEITAELLGVLRERHDNLVPETEAAGLEEDDVERLRALGYLR